MKDEETATKIVAYSAVKKFIKASQDARSDSADKFSRRKLVKFNL